MMVFKLEMAGLSALWKLSVSVHLCGVARIASSKRNKMKQ